MSKIIRLDDDVYLALKARASKEGKTLSATVYALMHIEDQSTSIQQQLSALESEITELKSLLLLNEGTSLHKTQNRWARPDLNRRPPPCQGDVITS